MIVIVVIIKGRKLGANTQHNNGISTYTFYAHSHKQKHTAQQKYLLIKVVNSFIAAESKIDPIPWDKFPYIGSRRVRACERASEWQSEQMKMVCAVQSTAKLFGFNVYLRKIHPFQIQWCMSTILKNCQHDTHTAVCVCVSVLCANVCIQFISVAWLIEIRNVKKAFLWCWWCCCRTLGLNDFTIFCHTDRISSAENLVFPSKSNERTYVPSIYWVNMCAHRITECIHFAVLESSIVGNIVWTKLKTVTVKR